MLKRNKAANSGQKNATCVRVGVAVNRVRVRRGVQRREAKSVRTSVHGLRIGKLRVEFTDFTHVVENISGNWPGNDGEKLLYVWRATTASCEQYSGG